MIDFRLHTCYILDVMTLTDSVTIAKLDVSHETLCARCHRPHTRTTAGRRQSYCWDCHAAYMRANRRKYSQLTEGQRLNSLARGHVNVLRQRGKILADVCVECGVTDKEAIIELHHPDIVNRPLDVEPLCHSCHSAEHGKQPSPRCQLIHRCR